jgi:hypothetical protein
VQALSRAAPHPLAIGVTVEHLAHQRPGQGALHKKQSQARSGQRPAVRMESDALHTHTTARQEHTHTQRERETHVSVDLALRAPLDLLVVGGVLHV